VTLRCVRCAVREVLAGANRDPGLSRRADQAHWTRQSQTLRSQPAEDDTSSESRSAWTAGYSASAATPGAGPGAVVRSLADAAKPRSNMAIRNAYYEGVAEADDEHQVNQDLVQRPAGKAVSRSTIACSKCQKPLAVKPHSGRIAMSEGVKVVLVESQVKLTCQCGRRRCGLFIWHGTKRCWNLSLS